MTDDNNRRPVFDLADGLLIVGLAAMLAAIYWIGGGAWLLLALGVLAVVVALRAGRRL